MRRHGIFLGGALAVLLGSCVDDAQTALVIVQAQVPDTKEGSCVIPGERTPNRLTQGTLDVAFEDEYPYKIYPLVTSEFPSIGDPGSLEPNVVDVQAVEIEIKAPPGITIPWTVNCPRVFDYSDGSVIIRPGESASMIVEAMRPCHSQLFRDLFAAGSLPSGHSEKVRFQILLRAKGRHGSTVIRSAPFQFPVRVCYGCLQTGFSGDYATFNFPKYAACEQLAQNPYMGNPCNPGQDGQILCCALESDPKNLRCPATPLLPPSPTP